MSRTTERKGSAHVILACYPKCHKLVYKDHRRAFSGGPGDDPTCWKARHEGTVVLQAIVRKDGKVDVVHLVRSLGFGLDQSAIDALKQWRFRPAMKDGMRVDATLNVEVRFNLR